MKKVLSVMLVLLAMCSMVACGGEESDTKGDFATKPIATNTTTQQETESVTQPETNPATEAETEIATEPSTEVTTPATTEEEIDNSSDSSIDPDFKAAMDSYEAFFDEYVAIMKKYKENPTDLSILTDYANYMGQYADMMQKLEKWENEDLNIAETAYYIEVQARIAQKLLEVA